MNNFLITFIPLVITMIIGIRTYGLARKILRLIKKIDYEKWQFLMSSSIPILNSLISEDSGFWVNTSRFGKFIKERNNLNDMELKKQIELYIKYRRLLYIFMFIMICWIIFMMLVSLVIRAKS